MPGTRDIKVYQGDRFTELYRFLENRGTAETPDYQPRDFTQVDEVRAQIRQRARSEEVLATFQCTFENADPTTGQIRTVLPSAEAANLTRDAVWDLEILIDGESETLLRGEVAVTLQVTR